MARTVSRPTLTLAISSGGAEGDSHQDELEPDPAELAQDDDGDGGGIDARADAAVPDALGDDVGDECPPASPDAIRRETLAMVRRNLKPTDG